MAYLLNWQVTWTMQMTPPCPELIMKTFAKQSSVGALLRQEAMTLPTAVRVPVTSAVVVAPWRSPSASTTPSRPASERCSWPQVDMADPGLSGSPYPRCALLYRSIGRAGPSELRCPTSSASASFAVEGCGETTEASSESTAASDRRSPTTPCMDIDCGRPGVAVAQS